MPGFWKVPQCAAKRLISETDQDFALLNDIHIHKIVIIYIVLIVYRTLFISCHRVLGTLKTL